MESRCLLWSDFIEAGTGGAVGTCKNSLHATYVRSRGSHATGVYSQCSISRFQTHNMRSIHDTIVPQLLAIIAIME